MTTCYAAHGDVGMCGETKPHELATFERMHVDCPACISLACSPYAPWSLCCDGDFWCRFHKDHASCCHCPPIEAWPSSPYQAISLRDALDHLNRTRFNGSAASSTDE